MRKERRDFWGKVLATLFLFAYVSEYQANPDVALVFTGIMWSDVVADLTLAYRELKKKDEDNNTTQTKFQ